MFGFNDSSPVSAKASMLVERSPDDVFRFIGEEFFKNYPRWSPEVLELRQLGAGPVQRGTRAHQIRVDQGHRTESTFVVTEFQPGGRVCFEGLSSPYRCDYELAPVGGNGLTRVTFTFELPRLELFMRPFEKLIRIAVQDGAERTVRNLKRLIEAECAVCSD